MEAKEYGNVGKKAIWFVKSLLCGYIVTGFLLLILALMLYKLGLSEQNVNAGIVLIYVISTFSAGFVLGKLAGKRKFLWGLFAGRHNCQNKPSLRSEGKCSDQNRNIRRIIL